MIYVVPLLDGDLLERDRTHRIYAIRFGTLQTTKSHVYHQFDLYEEVDGPQVLDYYFYVLDDGETLRAIDTGFSREEGEARGRAILHDPRSALERIGLDANAVTEVLISHFHYDHIGNIDLFPNATLVVPRLERMFYQSPIAAEPTFHAHTDPRGLEQIDRAGGAHRVREVDGETNVAPGLTMITVGGHTPGQQVFLVSTVRGTVLLASDAAHTYDEFERRRPFGVFQDLEKMYRAYSIIGDLAAEREADVVPAHDPDVVLRYPQVLDEGDVLGVILG